MNNIITIENNTIIFTPTLPGEITAESEKIPFNGSYAECSWEINRRGLCITAVIPENAKGRVRIPFADDVEVNGDMIWVYGLERKIKDVFFNKIETISTGDKFLWFDTNSGVYCFNLK